MVTRKPRCTSSDTALRVKDDIAADFAEGCTAGKTWNWHDSLVAQLAVIGARESAQVERDMETAMRVVSDMGLLEFNKRYLAVWCSYWWWGESAVTDD